MNLKVALQDVKKFETDALVVECYEDIRPLKGLAGELDWLLCSALSSLLAGGKFRGALGEAALVTPRGKIPVQKLFLIGRGARSGASDSSVRDYGRVVAATLRGAGAGRAAIEFAALPGMTDDQQLRALRSGLEEGAGGHPADLVLLVRDAALYDRLTRMVQGAGMNIPEQPRSIA